MKATNLHIPRDRYFWDEHGVRYCLAQCNAGDVYNWLLFPGGPGVDSCYYLSLLECVNLPGNVWLVDLPCNGSNSNTHEVAAYDYGLWQELLLPTVSKFKNPIYVGHSFGGMLPLLLPQLEKALSALVILSSTPVLWMEEAINLAMKKGIQSITQEMQAFAENPSDATFKSALQACMPYYFPANTVAFGAALLEQVTFNYHATNWWINKLHEINFSAAWVPQRIPTLIINGREDYICPATLFENDSRFKRDNITFKVIQDAGHFPWIEKPHEVKSIFEKFVRGL